MRASSGLTSNNEKTSLILSGSRMFFCRERDFYLWRVGRYGSPYWLPQSASSIFLDWMTRTSYCFYLRLHSGCLRHPGFPHTSSIRPHCLSQRCTSWQSPSGSFSVNCSTASFMEWQSQKNDFHQIDGSHFHLLSLTLSANVSRYFPTFWNHLRDSH